LSSAADCEVGNVRWWLGPGGCVERARPVLEDALEKLAAGAVELRSGRRKQLYRLELAGRAGEFLIKLNRYDRGAGPIRRLRRSKARRELAVASALRERGIEVALPFAAGEARQCGRLRCCYLLLPVLPEARDLRELWLREDAARRDWAEALGRLSRRLHDAGLLQADFAPNNFLLRAGSPPQILPVDFERARIRRRLTAGERAGMLAKLDRHLGGASAANRMRFLRAYADGDRSEARRWWRRLASAGARLAGRDFARLRRRACSDGRRFQCVRWRDWSGWALRDAPELALAEARTAGPEAARVPDTLGILVEAEAGLWRGSGKASLAEARSLWATAQLLWARGLAPRPVACLTRGEELRFWLARDASSRTLLQASNSPEAQRAAIVLADRLLALGRLDAWLSPRKLALVRRPDGGLRAQLIDPSAFRSGRPLRRRRRERARAVVWNRLREAQQLLEIVEESRS
jgi:tRNA A-37 threonylcarbamoyl transferase component Bud32